MSSISPAAQRRRTCLLASTFLVPVLSFGVSTAHAQQVANALPPIEINSPDENRTRAKPVTDEGCQIDSHDVSLRSGLRRPSFSIATDDDAADGMKRGGPPGQHPGGAVLLLDDRRAGDAGVKAEITPQMDRHLAIAAAVKDLPAGRGRRAEAARRFGQTQRRNRPGRADAFLFE